MTQTHPLPPVSLQQSETFNQCRCKVSNLHSFNFVDCFSELSDIFSSSLRYNDISYSKFFWSKFFYLNKFRFPIRVCEAFYKRSGFIWEGKNSDKIVLPKSLHYVEDNMLGNLLPKTGHRFRSIKQNNNILNMKKLWYLIWDLCIGWFPCFLLNLWFCLWKHDLLKAAHLVQCCWFASINHRSTSESQNNINCDNLSLAFMNYI